MTLLQQALEALESRCGTNAEERKTLIPALRAAIEKGMVVVPAKPTDECLHSMAVRYDHGLGMDGHYDNSIFDKSPTPHKHAQRLESTKRTMNQLYEEATGQGFYRPPAPTQEDGK